MPDSRSFISVGNISSPRQIAKRSMRFPSSFKRQQKTPWGMRAMHRFWFFIAVAVAIGSTGCAKKVVVPDVTQQDLDQAEKALTGLQLKVGTVSGIPSGNTTGAYVLSQSPAAGQQVKSDSPIDLVAAMPILVPDLTKSKVTDAVNTLQGLGLKVSLLKQPTANIFSRGGIKQQMPAPNTPVRPDAVVTLTVEAPPDLGGLVGMFTKEPAYEKLNPQYRQVLDQFLNAPNASGTPPIAPTSPTAAPASPTTAPPNPAPAKTNPPTGGKPPKH
jgi:beta-lactam-binding protein with PASTA domain